MRPGRNRGGVTAGGRRGIISKRLEKRESSQARGGETLAPRGCKGRKGVHPTSERDRMSLKRQLKVEKAGRKEGKHPFVGRKSGNVPKKIFWERANRKEKKRGAPERTLLQDCQEEVQKSWGGGVHVFYDGPALFTNRKEGGPDEKAVFSTAKSVRGKVGRLGIRARPKRRGADKRRGGLYGEMEN